MNAETRLQQEIMLALSQAGCVVWRNNTGQAWLGKVIHQAGKQITLTDAHKMPFGLCVGSSDLVGITPQGRFLAVEVKTPTGHVSKQQTAFIDGVRAAGGIAGIARSVQDAIDLIERG